MKGGINMKYHKFVLAGLAILLSGILALAIPGEEPKEGVKTEKPAGEKSKEKIREGKHIKAYKFKIIEGDNQKLASEFDIQKWSNHFFPKGETEGKGGNFVIWPTKRKNADDEKVPYAERNKDIFEMQVKIFPDVESAVDGLEKSLFCAEMAKEGIKSGNKLGDNCYWLPVKKGNVELDHGTILFTRKNVLVVLNGRQDWSYSYQEIEKLAEEIDKSILTETNGFKQSDMTDFIRLDAVKFSKTNLKRNEEVEITFEGKNIPNDSIRILGIDEDSFKYDSKSNKFFFRSPNQVGEMNLGFRILNTKKCTISNQATLKINIEE